MIRRFQLMDCFVTGLGAIIVLWSFVACRQNTGFRAVEVAGNVDGAVDFGRVFLTKSGSTSFAIRSTGGGKINVVGVETDCPEVEILSESRHFVVPSYSSQRVSLRWTPSAPVSLSCRVRVYALVERGVTWTVDVTGVALPMPTCDDGNICTDDSFDIVAELCQSAFNTSPCDDNDACTLDDQCEDGICRSGTYDRCDDDNPCTLDHCDHASGCLHPSDPWVCFDDDPCTVDTCTREEGCSWPDADFGTPCGAFDCKEIHVCDSGECIDLDISGYSDGYPCSDDDRCTEPDTCLSGECISGPALPTSPFVVHSFTTFGGAGELLATDGIRFLFASAERISVTTLGEAGLVLSAALPWQDVKAMLAVEPSRFWVLRGDGTLALLDVDDAAAPTSPWQHALTDPEPFGGTYDLVVTSAALAAKTAGGLLVAASFRYSASNVEVWTNSGVYFLALPSSAAPAGGLVPIVTGIAVPLELDSDGPSIAWLNDDSVEWRRHDGAGVVLEQASLLFPASRLSVWQRQVVVNDGSQIRVYDVVAGASPPDAAFELADTLDFFSGALPNADLLLQGSTLFVARDVRPEGVFAFTLGAEIDSGMVPVVVDTMSAARIRFETGHLLLQGDLALPLQQISAEPFTFARRFGSWHGDVVEAVELTDDTVRLAGPAVSAVFRPSDGQLLSWRIRETSARAAPPLVVLGTDGASVLPRAVNLAPCLWGPGCWGQTLEVEQLDDQFSQVPLCGLHSLTSLAVASERLWSYGPSAPPGGEPTTQAWALRAWAFRGAVTGPSTPIIEVENLAGSGDRAALTRLREARNPERLIVISVPDDDDPEVRVDLFASNAGALAALQTFFFACEDPACAGESEETTVLMEGGWLLRAARGALSLWSTTDPAQPQASLTFLEAAPDEILRLHAMEGRRAWMSYEDLGAAPMLHELYVSTSTLSNLGAVQLSGEVRSVLVQGQRAVVPTTRGIEVVGSACIR